MHTRTLQNIFIATMLGSLLCFGGAEIVLAQSAPVDDSGGVATAGIPTVPPSAERSLQSNGSLCIPIVSFDFVECIGAPLAEWTSDTMLSFGGSILQLSSALFDFAVNRLIINFRDTLQEQLQLMPIINGGWTFFRDLANILIIGIFVFIAISLILGLTEYGQKKLIARVLIIAILMNFSLLFTKIIIDSSNFVAYAIYAQTASPNTAAAADAPITFSIADKILKPLRIAGTKDTSGLNKWTASQEGGGAGAIKTLVFGILGFLILAVLAAIIFYGAFLIVARAIMFIFLMFSAPLAYASYLSPHFEASQLGWSNWWKSLINNAAFAPLLMMFLSISILIMQSAAISIPAGSSLGDVLNDPSKQVLANGWRVLFVYLLGTALLFISFRLSSSLAGSISGIKMGQMAAMAPLGLSAAFASKSLQRTAGAGLAKWADSKGAEHAAARLAWQRSGSKEDYAKMERLRKQKDLLDKGARSSFNLLNTKLGKAATGTTGAGGVFAGQTKETLADRMKRKGEAALDKAKGAQVTDKDKAAHQDAEIQKARRTAAEEKQNAAVALETANTVLQTAVKEKAAADDQKLMQEAENQVAQNRIEKAPDLDRAEQEVKVVQTKHSDAMASNTAEIQNMMQKAQASTSTAERDKQIRAVESRKQEHAMELKKQAAHIDEARQKVTTLTTEIEAPVNILKQRQQSAATEIANRTTDFKNAQNRLVTAEKGMDETQITRVGRENAKGSIKVAEAISRSTIHDIATKAAGKTGNAHMVEHVFDERLKKVSKTESALSAMQKFMEKTATKNADQ